MAARKGGYFLWPIEDLEVSEILPESPTLIACPNCGAPMTASALSCPECRRPVSIATTPKPKTDWKKRFGPLGVVIVILVKFKSVVLLALTKAKFLIFGLTKLKTILSMLAFLGVYWGLYGWKWALGFVVAIYIHEMGHVWALKQFGLRASSPMFIPFFGALVSLYESPANVGQDARIGLAGPIWGTGAAIAFALPALVTHDGIWLAIAHTAAYLNLFNLLPVWQLDGGRGFRALDKQQRLMLLGLMLVLWYLSGSGLFLILSLGALYRIFLAKDFAREPDQGAFVQFAGLLTMLGGLLYLIGDSYLR